MNAQSYYGCIRVEKTILKLEAVFALVDVLNSDDGGLKDLIISHLIEVGL